MTLGLLGKKGLYALPQYRPISIPAATSARQQQLQERATHPSSNPNPCKRLHYASHTCCKDIETLPHRNQEENRPGEGLCKEKIPSKEAIIITNSFTGTQNH